MTIKTDLLFEETIKVKKGFSQNTKERSKRNAALSEMGHKFIEIQPREKQVLEFNPGQIEYVELGVMDIDTGTSARCRVNLESIRRRERELLVVDENLRIHISVSGEYLSKGCAMKTSPYSCWDWII